MTLHCRDLSAMPADIAAVGAQVLPPTKRYRVIGDHLADLWDEAQFAALYDTRGRHALSPALLAMVTLFQFLEDIPDREAAEQVVVRLDWKYGLHLPLEDTGFDYSCLCYFGQRVLDQHQDTLVFETILGKVRALGFLKKRGKERTDSIAVLGAVRQLSALETVTETLRLAVRALVAADVAWLEQAVPASFADQYADLRPDYRLTVEEQAALFRQVGQDGYWLLDRLEAAPMTLRDLAAVTVLREMWAQRYTRDAGRGTRAW
jgi:transposase